MHYIVPALVVEGSTDSRLFGDLLRRLLTDVLYERCEGAFEISDALEIAVTHGSVSSAELGEFLSMAGSCNLIFLHRDSDSRDREKVVEALRPVLEGLDPSVMHRVVKVIPVRTMEAWLFADGDALRSCLGVTWSDEKLGVPRLPKDVEKIADPKAAMAAISSKISGPKSNLLVNLGEEISLARLAEVPSFGACRDDVIHALTEDWIVS